MDSSQNCVYNRHSCYRHLAVSLLFLLVSSLTQVKFMADGRGLSKMMMLAAPQKGIEEEMVAVVRNPIGSRPPRCEKKCRSCEHCEAIQVPVTKIQAQGSKKSHHFSAVSYVNVRGDDISNYKPMSWKCKCGNLIFDPS